MADVEATQDGHQMTDQWGSKTQMPEALATDNGKRWPSRPSTSAMAHPLILSLKDNVEVLACRADLHFSRCGLGCLC